MSNPSMESDVLMAALAVGQYFFSPLFIITLTSDPAIRIFFNQREIFVKQ